MGTPGAVGGRGASGEVLGDDAIIFFKKFTLLLKNVQLLETESTCSCKKLSNFSANSEENSLSGITVGN